MSFMTDVTQDLIQPLGHLIHFPVLAAKILSICLSLFLSIWDKRRGWVRYFGVRIWGKRWGGCGGGDLIGLWGVTVFEGLLWGQGELKGFGNWGCLWGLSGSGVRSSWGPWCWGAAGVGVVGARAISCDISWDFSCYISCDISWGKGWICWEL